MHLNFLSRFWFSFSCGPQKCFYLFVVDLISVYFFSGFGQQKQRPRNNNGRPWDGDTWWSIPNLGTETGLICIYIPIPIPIRITIRAAHFPFFMFIFCVGSLVRITGQLCRILVPLIVVYLYNYKIESSHKFVWFSCGGVLTSSEFPLLERLTWQRVKVLKIVNSFNIWGKTSFWIDILLDGGKSTWRSGMPANGPQSGLIAVA